MQGQYTMQRQERGFTLVELALVFVVVALLLGGLLVPLTTQIEQQRIRETQKAMEEIKEALIGFALANGRLPCPAEPALASDQAGAGKERLTCNTIASSVGVMPWVSLGVNEGDAWGRRFTYRVTESFSDAIASNTVTPPGTCITLPSMSSFALCSQGNSDVFTKAAGGVNVAAGLPAVIISHGKNGLGAYQQSTGIQIANIDAGDDEKENADADSSFVSRTHTGAQASCNDGSASPPCEFDDLVTWLSPNILFNRMVAAGKLP
jgi:type II secretory pathway pseudopilin PulG